MKKIPLGTRVKILPNITIEREKFLPGATDLSQLINKEFVVHEYERSTYRLKGGYVKLPDRTLDVYEFLIPADSLVIIDVEIIIEQKKLGFDCTEFESSMIKGILKDILINFPIEYSEFLQETNQ